MRTDGSIAPARRTGQLAANPTPVRRGWPIVGWLIAIAAHHRDRRGARQVRHALAWIVIVGLIILVIAALIIIFWSSGSGNQSLVG